MLQAPLNNSVVLLTKVPTSVAHFFSQNNISDTSLIEKVVSLYVFVRQKGASFIIKKRKLLQALRGKLSLEEQNLLKEIKLEIDDGLRINLDECQGGDEIIN